MVSESLPATLHERRSWKSWNEIAASIRDQSMRSVKSGSEVTFFVF